MVWWSDLGLPTGWDGKHSPRWTLLLPAVGHASRGGSGGARGTAGIVDLGSWAAPGRLRVVQPPASKTADCVVVVIVKRVMVLVGVGKELLK